MHYWQRKAKFIFAWVAFFGLGTGVADALSIEAFCPGNLGVRQIGMVSIYYPNAHNLIDQKMSKEMHTSGDPKLVVLRHQREMKRAIEDFAHAKRLGLKQIPAVVFDHRFVILGTCDIGKAKAVYFESLNVGPELGGSHDSSHH